MVPSADKKAIHVSMACPVNDATFNVPLPVLRVVLVVVKTAWLSSLQYATSTALSVAWAVPVPVLFVQVK